MFLLSEKRVSQNTFSAYQRDVKQLLQFLVKEHLNLDIINKLAGLLLQLFLAIGMLLIQKVN